MFIVFFDNQDIVHFKFLPQGQTVNQTVYKEVLRRLVRSVLDKRRSLWEANAWALHHDKAAELQKIPENAFQECFESWKRRMHKCSQVEGDDFEGV